MSDTPVWAGRTGAGPTLAAKDQSTCSLTLHHAASASSLTIEPANRCFVIGGCKLLFCRRTGVGCAGVMKQLVQIYRQLLLGNRGLHEWLDGVELVQIDGLVGLDLQWRPGGGCGCSGRRGIEPRHAATSGLPDGERESESGPRGELHHSADGLYFAIMNRWRGVMGPVLLFAFVFLAGTRDVAAQALVGRVAGTIRDESGKPVAGATITATNPEQALTLTATSDVKGRFGMLGLRRGVWVFAIAAPGFQKVSQAGEVQIGNQNPPLNVKLVKSPTPQPGPLSNLSGSDIQSMIDAAEASAASGDLAAAIGTYRDLLSKIPALTTGYLRVGALLEQKGDAAGALETYRQLAQLEPDNARAAAAIARLARIP